MNTKRRYENPPLARLNKQRLSGAVALLLLLPLAARAGGVVTNCTEAALRAAMAGGGTVTFACDGTITLTGTITNMLDTVLDAAGHQVTVSGGDSVRVFCVSTNMTFSLNHLTIAHGRSTNGAGLLNAGGTVNATNTTFDGNEVLGVSSLSSPGATGGSAVGGAVANYGVMNLANCSFTNNSAFGGAGGPDPSPGYAYGCPGGTGSGGAVWNSGLLTGSGCTFAGNSAAGGTGGDGGTGYVGGVPTTLKADPGVLVAMAPAPHFSITGWHAW